MPKAGWKPPWTRCGQGAQYTGGEQPTFLSSEFRKIIMGDFSKSLFTRFMQPVCWRCVREELASPGVDLVNVGSGVVEVEVVDWTGSLVEYREKVVNVFRQCSNIC